MMEMENGKINCVDDVCVVDKYYREYTELMADANKVRERFKEENFKLIEKKEYIMDELMMEDDFRKKYVDVAQISCIPGYRFMTRLILKQIS